MGFYLKNIDGEYIKSIEGGNLEFTKDVDEAFNYAEMPGGEWYANNEKPYIVFHYGDEYGDRVKTLRCVAI